MEPSRRGVLTGLCACGLAACAPVPDTGDTAAGGDLVEVGLIEDFPVGTLTPVVGEGVAVGHDHDGLYAISTICTHRGCDMGRTGTVDATGLDCSCHGSEFDPDGAVEEGPATRPLPFYAVVLDQDDAVLVDFAEVVGPDERTPVG